MNENSNVMGWNDALENDGTGYVVLPEGDYLFKVVSFERARYPGSAKIEPCNKAVINAEVEYEGSTVPIKFDLILYRTLEWKLSSFFRAIGLKKSGERLVMDWSKVPGAKGKCHIKTRTYTDKDGNERQSNDVASFMDYDPKDWNEPSWLNDAKTASWEQGTF